MFLSIEFLEIQKSSTRPVGVFTNKSLGVAGERMLRSYRMFHNQR